MIFSNLPYILASLPILILVLSKVLDFIGSHSFSIFRDLADLLSTVWYFMALPFDWILNEIFGIDYFHIGIFSVQLKDLIFFTILEMVALYLIGYILIKIIKV